MKLGTSPVEASGKGLRLRLEWVRCIHAVCWSIERVPKMQALMAVACFVLRPRGKSLKRHRLACACCCPPYGKPLGSSTAKGLYMLPVTYKLYSHCS